MTAAMTKSRWSQDFVLASWTACGTSAFCIAYTVYTRYESGVFPRPCTCPYVQPAFLLPALARTPPRSTRESTSEGRPAFIRLRILLLQWSRYSRFQWHRERSLALHMAPVYLNSRTCRQRFWQLPQRAAAGCLQQQLHHGMVSAIAMRVCCTHRRCAQGFFVEILATVGSTT